VKLRSLGDASKQSSSEESADRDFAKERREYPGIVRVGDSSPEIDRRATISHTGVQMKSLRLLGSTVLLFALAACAGSSSADIAGPSFAKGGGTPTPPPPTAPSLVGHWTEVQNPPFLLPDGTSQVTFYEFDVLTQKGSVLDGKVNRYVSYWDAAMQPIVVRRNLGTAGTLTGSINGTAVTLGFIKVGEGKLTSGYAGTLSADGKTITISNPTEFGPHAFTRP
jgi:hypothetical protein